MYLVIHVYIIFKDTLAPDGINPCIQIHQIPYLVGIYEIHFIFHSQYPSLDKSNYFLLVIKLPVFIHNKYTNFFGYEKFISL